MDISESHVKFSWKIEPKPEGGFIARSENPGWTLEGATRDEVESKIRAKIAEIAGAETADKLAGDKLGHPGVNVNIHKKITFSLRKPGDGQAADAYAPQRQSRTPAAIEPSGFSHSTLMKVLIVVGVLLIVLVFLRR